jgi:phosphatidylinositol alpha-1,6-mannosyltransferase
LLLYITRKFPPQVGGMEVASFHLSRELARHEPVRLIAWRRSPKLLGVFFWRAAIQMIHLSRVRAPVSLVYFSDAFSAFLAPLARRLFPRAALVATAHGLDVTYPLPPYQVAVRWALGELDYLICDSHRTREVCLERGVPAERCSVVGLGVDCSVGPGPSRSDKLAARKQLAGRFSLDLGERPVILTVGRLVERKGVAWFVGNVLPRLGVARPDVRYLVAGAGPAQPDILRAARDHGVSDRVMLLGRVDDDARELLYRAADLFVMPNVLVPGDVEGFGLVLLEANAAGLWAVASAIDGIVDAVTPETGDLLPSAEPEPWIAHLSTLAADRAACWERGRQAAEHVRAHASWAAIATRYRAIFAAVRVARGLNFP